MVRSPWLNRCGKSCRLRWINYLRPDVKRGEFSEEEERVIVNLHSALGNKWSRIANHLPGRTDNEIKNFWNTHIRKKLLQMGIDPHTHKPRIDPSHIFESLSAAWCGTIWQHRKSMEQFSKVTGRSHSISQYPVGAESVTDDESKHTDKY
ncbi:hypothetical protein OIU77_027392 [Salix suchowensis]|uniref:Uncharacterized protein n=1 Tax=Salix suchowensis TaxID=1278906 RepID=A0ABQ9BTU8_9ROSI|nr:hypothetical protein OIU77_027392 [Salix suchowensis]